MLHQPKVELQEKIKNWERERERERERESKQFMKNKMRIKIVKIKYMVINTKLFKSCYIIE